MKLEQLEDYIFKENLNLIKDNIPVEKMKGLYFDGNIVYDKSLETDAEKVCIIAEEVGHYKTSVGNILDYSSVKSAKQERIARAWASEHLISFDDIIKASRQGIANRFELAEFLEVTEEFLQETIQLWKERYGLFIKHGNYVITLDPFGVINNLKDFNNE